MAVSFASQEQTQTLLSASRQKGRTLKAAAHGCQLRLAGTDPAVASQTRKRSMLLGVTSAQGHTLDTPELCSAADSQPVLRAVTPASSRCARESSTYLGRATLLTY